MFPMYDYIRIIVCKYIVNNEVTNKIIMMIVETIGFQCLVLYPERKK